MDNVLITSLAQLRKLFLPLSDGWNIQRSRHGYYYFTHPTHAPSSGVYVFNCKGTTLLFLDQRITRSPWRHIMTELKISRAELKTLFYIGRKLELIACYVPVAAPQPRTVKEHKSYGYVMALDNGRLSYLRHETGSTITAMSPAGNGITEVKITDAIGKTSAHYRLL